MACTWNEPWKVLFRRSTTKPLRRLFPGGVWRKMNASSTSPTTPINVSGPETLSVRWLVQELAARLEVKPNLIGEEAPTAWLTNSAQATKLFGYPSVPLAAMLDWVADWVAAERRSLGKPTKYEVRSGSY